MSARTVIEHALRVYYADSRDPHGFVEKLLAKYDADHLREAAALVEDRACDADFTESRDYCAGLREGVEVLNRAAANDGEKDTRGHQPHEGESTHQPPRPHALPESSFARARQCERIGGFFRCARIAHAEAGERRAAQ